MQPARLDIQQQQGDRDSRNICIRFLVNKIDQLVFFGESKYNLLNFAADGYCTSYYTSPIHRHKSCVYI
jgi:hypothetical protein